MRYFVTGCAGFIGSTLTDRLLADGHEVVGYDNFSTGQERFLAAARECARFRLMRGDVLDPAALARAMLGSEFVFHLAANADVRFGLDHPDRDFEQNTLATRNVLAAMLESGIGRIAFASTGSVYGDARVVPTPEAAPFPVQTSLYGASKVAGEALIAAYSNGFGWRSYIFRFVSILGARYSHGHIYDFYRQLHADSSRLRVLGSGHQRKSYLEVRDCIDAMLMAIERAQDPVNIFNLGTDDYCEVRESVAWICDSLGIAPEFDYGGGARGWIGDNPFVYLDTSKIRALGWHPRFTIRQGVLATLEYLTSNRWLLEARA